MKFKEGTIVKMNVKDITIFTLLILREFTSELYQFWSAPRCELSQRVSEGIVISFILILII